MKKKGKKMKKRILVLPVVMGMLFTFLSGARAAPEDTKARIIEASQTFFGPPDPSITQKKIVDALHELLDIAASINPEFEYKDKIKYRIDVAKDLLKNTSIFNAKARQYLSFAYRMMTNGKKYEKPKELDEFVTPAEAEEKARKYAKQLVDEALGHLEDGNAGETARLLLELVLMIVTPTSG
ncbi:MAG: hypothetical protein JSW00_11805 [Thermoplasmata archaeon]|nr:MAG: hypothetical protein JSW00_11805 [Thermoplasmata archaeon]